LTPVIECVPNFSEGRDPVIVAALGRAVGPLLLDTTSDPDHHRSVLTFAGAPENVARAALSVIAVAVERIEITRHAGVHPRIGAADVVPFVPVADITLQQCAELAAETAERVWKELRLPVYLYEAAARRPECRRLESIRKLAPAGLPPDIGDGRHPTAGACVIGARKFLIAWNINLTTTDLAAAKRIAAAIRESSGGLPAVKALGLPLAARGQVQVSINLVDFEITPLHVVFEAVAERCSRARIEIAGSELIGMIPASALEASKDHDLRWENLRPEAILEPRRLASSLRESSAPPPHPPYSY
jgi:glutamate formiminotransferase